MSYFKSCYVIAGYDLTNHKTDEYRDWKWTDEGEKYLCCHRVGKIQLFDQSNNGDDLYLGMILAAGDECEFCTTKFDMQDIKNAWENVTLELSKLINMGIIRVDPKKTPIYQIIAFEECR